MAETSPHPNKHLRYERERRGWSQQEVADKVGTTPLNVGRWERGVTVPGPYFRVKLSEVFEKSPYELGLVVERPVPPNPSTSSSMSDKTSTLSDTHVSHWNVPYRRNSFFTGREEVLDRLHAALSAQSHPIAISQPQAISGLGGIGKTQLAVEYAYRHRCDFKAVFWARAESPDLLISDYLTIAALLELKERNEQEQGKIVNAILHWFDTHEGWLLILDNADDLEMAREFLPSSGKGSVLLTTRASSTGTIAGRIELESMTIEEGLLFFLRRIKRIRGNASLENVPENLQGQARAIVEAVDALPLAIDQAGAYIEETGSSLSDYLKLYHARRQRLLLKRGQDGAGHPEPVATTWSLAFEKIEQANLAAGELLHLLALLHPDNIPETLIVSGAKALGPILQLVVSDEIDFNEALRELHKYSLIKRDSEARILSIHRLVQAVIWDGMGEQERERWMERTIAALNIVFPETISNATLDIWKECERLLPHVLICTANTATQKHNLELASLLYKAGTYLCERAQYEQAELLYQQALTIRENTLEPDHLDIAESLSGLASLYSTQGKYEQAELLLQRALIINEQKLGTDHLHVAELLNDLGLLYRHQGKYQQTEIYYQRCLTTLEQVLGSDHPSIADSLNNIAMLYVLQGKYEEAEPFHKRALHIRERALGSDHPKVAQSLNNLGFLYNHWGKYEQAEPFYRHSLTIWEQTLGSSHPNVATSLNNLGLLYHSWGKYEQAEPFYQQCLTIEEQIFGVDHHRVGKTFNNLAELYREQGKYEQAEQYHQRALKIREEALGPHHPDVAQSHMNIARLSYDQGKYEQAEVLYQLALSDLETALGQEHPNVATCLNHLAKLYTLQGSYEQAEPLYRRALTIRQGHYGPQNPQTAESLHDFAHFYEVRMQPEEALALFLEALAIRKQQFGPKHRRTIDTLTHALALLRELERIEEAIVLEVEYQ